MRWTGGVILAVALAGGVAARDLPVPADKGWQHAETGLILPARLDGLPRTKLADSTQGEFDVTAEFAAPDQSVVATLYLFHPAVDDVSIWFERSLAQITHRDVYGGVEAITPAPVAFAAPGTHGDPDSLRQTFRAGGHYKSTALAMMPLGRWLVAVRLSATSGDTAALDQRLTRLIAAIRWPASPLAAPALRSIAPCPDALAFEKAKTVKPEGADVLLTLLASSVANDPKAAKDSKPVTWCLDPATTGERGIYRPADGGKGYLIALQDAGRTMGVWPGIGTQIGIKGAAAYSVSFEDVDGRTSALLPFDRLPAPDQVIALLRGPAVGGSTAGRDGKRTITFDPKSL